MPVLIYLDPFSICYLHFEEIGLTVSIWCFSNIKAKFLKCSNVVFSIVMLHYASEENSIRLQNVIYISKKIFKLLLTRGIHNKEESSRDIKLLSEVKFLGQSISQYSLNFRTLFFSHCKLIFTDIYPVYIFRCGFCHNRQQVAGSAAKIYEGGVG